MPHSWWPHLSWTHFDGNYLWQPYLDMSEFYMKFEMTLEYTFYKLFIAYFILLVLTIASTFSGFDLICYIVSHYTQMYVYMYNIHNWNICFLKPYLPLFCAIHFSIFYYFLFYSIFVKTMLVANHLNWFHNKLMVRDPQFETPWPKQCLNQTWFEKKVIMEEMQTCQLSLVINVKIVTQKPWFS